MKLSAVQVRIEPELREKLQAQAQKDRRSLAAMIRVILQDAAAASSAHTEARAS
jgi:predicted HicB family RNase H-like nuclease